MDLLTMNGELELNSSFQIKRLEVKNMKSLRYIEIVHSTVVKILILISACKMFFIREPTKILFYN